MTTKTDELKPCPFCRHRTIFTQPDEVGSGGQWVGPVHVGCNKCKAEQTGDDESAARANWNTRAALQEQPAIPVEIRLMAERIAADDFDHCTADPIFTVQRKRLITGIVTDYTEDIGWLDEDGNLIESEEAKELEARYEETGDAPDVCTRTGYFEEWEHFATYVTMEAAQEFVEKKGDQYRVYVDSGRRNHEWKALRSFLLSLAPARRRIEGEGR